MTIQFYSDDEKKKYKSLFEYLRQIDPLIATFMRKRGLKLISSNNQRCPERSLGWENSRNLECLVQIYLNSDQKTFKIWLCASQDRDNKRYWKQVNKVEALTPPFDSKQLEQLFEESFQWLEDVKESDLEFAANIQPLSKL